MLETCTACAESRNDLKEFQVPSACIAFGESVTGIKLFDQTLLVCRSCRASFGKPFMIIDEHHAMFVEVELPVFLQKTPANIAR